MTGQKQRHGCLTALLIVMIIANSASTLAYLLFARRLIQQNRPNTPDWVLPVLILFSAFNVVCSIALFQWKKWGFWGFCVSSVAGLAVNLSLGLGVGTSLLGLGGVILLYGVLQIGTENKGWPQLE